MSDPAGARELSIDAAAADDCEALARLHASLFDPPWDAGSFGRLLAHPGALAFVARAGEVTETAGFILGRVAADEAEILTLGVAERWQRQGIGERLVDALGRAARDRQAIRLYLEVADSNAAARALYHRLGFQETSRRKDYYMRAGGRGEDAINLALVL